MKTKAYIIKNNQIIAEVKTELKNGESVRFAYQKTRESIDANREFSLVNARDGKISRAKKWLKEAEKRYQTDYAIEINEGEFCI